MEISGFVLSCLVLLYRDMYVGEKETALIAQSIRGPALGKQKQGEVLDFPFIPPTLLWE